MATRAVFSEAWKKLGVSRKARKKHLAVLRLWFGRLRRKEPEIRSADETINQENMSCRPWPRSLSCCPAAREAPNGSWCINMLMTASLSEINTLIVCIEQRFAIPRDTKICWRFFRASRWHSSYRIYLFYGFEALSDTYQRPFHDSTMHNIFCNRS